MREKAALGSGRFGGADAIPQRAQGIQRVVQNYIFFDVVGFCGKQLSDPGKDGLLRLCNPLRNWFRSVSNSAA